MKEIKCRDQLLAIIIPHTYHKPGISFFTPDNFSQQLAYMEHPVEHNIAPHVHNLIKREVYYTQEVLLIRKGKLRVDFYDDDKNYIESCILEVGDVILLVKGGHGFKVLEDLEMFEIKQGPYLGENDKTRFEGISDEKVIIRDDF
ncbi:MAG: hypothetical protein J6O04_05770 [Selenomonadaceae bacterium]|nr:hypothetical protein [Selenomonadaceae bacterium]